jgi:hypothetical protein
MSLAEQRRGVNPQPEVGVRSPETRENGEQQQPGRLKTRVDQTGARSYPLKAACVEGQGPPATAVRLLLNCDYFRSAFERIARFWGLYQRLLARNQVSDLSYCSSSQPLPFLVRRGQLSENTQILECCCIALYKSLRSKLPQ